MSVSDPGLRRVSVHVGTAVLDLSLPAGVPVATLIPSIVDILAERDDPHLRSRLEGLVGAATGGLLDPERLFGEAFVQHEDHVAEIASQIGVDAELLATLASQAVAPLLRAYADHLLLLLARIDDGTSQGAAWHQGYCPVCGGWPILAELRGLSELRRGYLSEAILANCLAVHWPVLSLPAGPARLAPRDPRMERRLVVPGLQ